jgi:hypothetical protein
MQRNADPNCCRRAPFCLIPCSQPHIRKLHYKERCLLNHKREKQVVSNGNSF